MPINQLTITAVGKITLKKLPQLGGSTMFQQFVAGFHESIEKDIKKDKDCDKIDVKTLYIDDKNFVVELHAPKEIAKRLFKENKKQLNKLKNKMALKASGVKILNEYKE